MVAPSWVVIPPASGEPRHQPTQALTATREPAASRHRDLALERPQVAPRAEPEANGRRTVKRGVEQSAQRLGPLETMAVLTNPGLSCCAGTARIGGRPPARAWPTASYPARYRLCRM